MKIEDKIESIINSFNIDTEELSEILKTNGFTDIKEIEGAEDRECDSVSWDNSYLFDFDSKKYSLYTSGTAIAEVSYERWVDTFGYTLDYWSVSEIAA